MLGTCAPSGRHPRSRCRQSFRLGPTRSPGGRNGASEVSAIGSPASFFFLFFLLRGCPVLRRLGTFPSSTNVKSLAICTQLTHHPLATAQTRHADSLTADQDDYRDHPPRYGGPHRAVTPRNRPLPVPPPTRSSSPRRSSLGIGARSRNPRSSENASSRRMAWLSSWTREGWLRRCRRRVSGRVKERRSRGDDLVPRPGRTTGRPG